MHAVAVRGLTKSFKAGKALADVELAVAPGEMVALIGASGAGKSTLIRQIAGLAAADAGEIEALGGTVQREGRLAPGVRALRAETGVIFQQFNLVGRLSLLSNVLIGLLGRISPWRGYLGRFTYQEQQQAMACLYRVGLHTRAAQRASTLSGGQQQRAAIARALLQRARLLLADEPIASLDPRAARRVMEILSRINRDDGVTVIVSLHQVAYAISYCPRAVALRDGQVVYDGDSQALTPDLLGELYGADSETLFLPDAGEQPARGRADCRAGARGALNERESRRRQDFITRPIRGGVRMKTAWMAAIAALGIGAGSAFAQDVSELNFGIISTESSQALQESFQPFLDDMSAALGMPVRPFFAPDYAGVIEGMRFDKVDLAWFGNKSAMEAVDRASGEVFAQTIKDDGSEGYYSLLIAHKDSPVDSLDDVLACDQSLAFGNGDPNSTSGFLVPSYYVFALNGIDPKSCFSTVVNANHETNALAVANGQVDVATNNTESIYARLAQTDPEAFSQIKEIWRSPLIPSDPPWSGARACRKR